MKVSENTLGWAAVLEPERKGAKIRTNNASSKRKLFDKIEIKQNDRFEAG